MASFLCECCKPICAEILRPRVVALCIAAMGAAQLSASTVGWGIRCPFHALTGLPCPGCGLTRSVLALLHGNFAQSIALHPFGPLLFFALLASILLAFLPEFIRGKILRWLAILESRTAFAPVLTAMFMLLWMVRLTGVLPLAHI